MSEVIALGEKFEVNLEPYDFNAIHRLLVNEQGVQPIKNVKVHEDVEKDEIRNSVRR